MYTALRASALFAALILTACSEPEPAGSAASELAASSDAALVPSAVYRMIFSHTPTIGAELPTQPVLTLTIVVDDTKLREAHPEFDGLEHAFARLPQRRIELPFSHRELRGFIQTRLVDVHRAENLRVTADELSTILESGVEIGIESNAGILVTDKIVPSIAD